MLKRNLSIDELRLIVTTVIGVMLAVALVLLMSGLGKAALVVAIVALPFVGATSYAYIIDSRTTTTVRYVIISAMILVTVIAAMRVSYLVQ